MAERLTTRMKDIKGERRSTQKFVVTVKKTTLSLLHKDKFVSKSSGKKEARKIKG